MKSVVLPMVIATAMMWAVAVPAGVASAGAPAVTQQADDGCWLWIFCPVKPSPTPTPPLTPRPTLTSPARPTSSPTPSTKPTPSQNPTPLPSVPGQNPSPATPAQPPSTSADKPVASSKYDDNDRVPAPQMADPGALAEVVNPTQVKVTIDKFDANNFIIKGSKTISTTSGPLRVLVLGGSWVHGDPYTIDTADAGPHLSFSSDITGENMEVYVTKLVATISLLGIPVTITLNPDTIPSWLPIWFPVFSATKVQMDQALVKLDIKSLKDTKIIAS